MTFDDIVKEVNSFTEELLSGHSPNIPARPKVINDPLHGSQFFSRHEIAIIDSPLLQRLKNIKQLGLVFQVYPSATHSRFEHSLGVTTVAERVLRAVYQRAELEGEKPFNKLSRAQGDLGELRLAALLHDIGHGLCSHLSEQIYERHPEVEALKKEREEFRNKGSGEILSYLMVQSPAVLEFLRTVLTRCKVKVDLDNVSQMILGTHPKPAKLYLAQIISGPFDADKLDYIARDSYFCGLALTVDLPRLYSTIAVAKPSKANLTLKRTKFKAGSRILVLRDYVPLEQILFSKMTLFGSVYHHQKVKCLDHMLRSLVEESYSEHSPVSIGEHDITFKNPVEYMYAPDQEFFGGATSDNAFVSHVLRRLRERDLLARCVEISRRTVHDWGDQVHQELTRLSKSTMEHRRLQGNIYELLASPIQKKLHSGEVLLSVPKLPSLKPDRAYIQSGPGGELIDLEEYFPLPEWTQSYANSKWKSYVYAPRKYRKSVRRAAIKALEALGVQIDLDASDRLCKVS